MFDWGTIVVDYSLVLNGAEQRLLIILYVHWTAMDIGLIGYCIIVIIQQY